MLNGRFPNQEKGTTRKLFCWPAVWKVPISWPALVAFPAESILVAVAQTRVLFAHAKMRQLSKLKYKFTVGHCVDWSESPTGRNFYNCKKVTRL